MVHDRPDVFAGPASPDQIAVAFDDERLVSDAGLLLPASLAGRLEIERLVNDTVHLGAGVPGAAHQGEQTTAVQRPGGVRSSPRRACPRSPHRQHRRRDPSRHLIV
jgi:hypothetical protein